MPLHACVDKDWVETLENALMSDFEWDPVWLESPGTEIKDLWHDSQDSFPNGPMMKTLDEHDHMRERKTGMKLKKGGKVVGRQRNVGLEKSDMHTAQETNPAKADVGHKMKILAF